MTMEASPVTKQERFFYLKINDENNEIHYRLFAFVKLELLENVLPCNFYSKVKTISGPIFKT